MASGDPREIRIPRKLNSSTEEYAALGFEELGEARREYRDDPVYRLVRLPKGWSLVRDPNDPSHRSVVVDNRGIERAWTHDTHKEWDRDAFTTVIKVGVAAASMLFAKGDEVFDDVNASLTSIKFDRLTDEEVEALVEELERMAQEPPSTEVYNEYIRRAKHWLGILAERFRLQTI